MNTSFRNLDRVGAPFVGVPYGPQLVGAYGPQLVGQGAMVPHRGGVPSAHHGLPAHHGVYQSPYSHPAAYPHPYAGHPTLAHNPPTQVREFIIGFGPTSVAAATTAIFQAQPQLIFRGSRLIIPSTIANNFVVNDIRVGKDSQAVSANPIPAAAFSELGVGVALGLDTATPGILITLSVANTTGGAQTFSAALIGTSMQ